MVTGTWFKMASEKFVVPYMPLKTGESLEI